jgi:hypothetical protein
MSVEIKAQNGDRPLRLVTDRFQLLFTLRSSRLCRRKQLFTRDPRKKPSRQKVCGAGRAARSAVVGADLWSSAPPATTALSYTLPGPLTPAGAAP